MAVCDVCNQEMTIADGCLYDQLVIAGEHFNRIRVHVDTCTDCGAKYDLLHRFGCDQEI